MIVSRREFVATSLAGAAGLCVGGYSTKSNAAEPQAQLLDEDGYKLWLRYMPPGNAAKGYRRIVRHIRVDGTSAACGIIRDELLGKLSPRYADYARACASIGINGAVISNVNADVRLLAPESLRKAGALADVWRPYGVRMYLSANFAAPAQGSRRAFGHSSRGLGEVARPDFGIFRELQQTTDSPLHPIRRTGRAGVEQDFHAAGWSVSFWAYSSTATACWRVTSGKQSRYSSRLRPLSRLVNRLSTGTRVPLKQGPR
jgi:hypothetical protein